MLRPLIAPIFMLMRGLACVLAALSVPATAQELLANRSFESALSPSPVNGNNFYSAIPNWTITNVSPPQANPWNIIRPHAGYANNPTATPTGGGSLYLDVNSASGRIRQTITIPSNGMIDFSGWFSVRDFAQALTGLTINIRNSSNVIVATTSTSFTAANPIGLWKQALAANVPISAGTYTFEVEIPNYANFDLASVVFRPSLTVTKTSTARSDPVSSTNPKLIPGGIAEYTITVTSPASYASTNIVAGDTTPANMALVVADFGPAGSGPVSFSAGTSGLAYTFSSLGSATDRIEFSNNNGLSWGYTPIQGANGTDPLVTGVRILPTGTMAAASTFSFRLRFRIN